MFGEFSIEQFLNVVFVSGGQPATFDEEVGQGSFFSAAPGGAGFGETSRIDEIGLEGQHAE